jgi:hypothetical protein
MQPGDIQPFLLLPCFDIISCPEIASLVSLLNMGHCNSLFSLSFALNKEWVSSDAPSIQMSFLKVSFCLCKHFCDLRSHFTKCLPPPPISIFLKIFLLNSQSVVLIWVSGQGQKVRADIYIYMLQLIDGV